MRVTKQINAGHSAKGQEWTSVFLLNAVDGCLPSDLATGSTPEIEEERRVLYAAMTRAKDQLHLMVPQRFFTHGQRSTGDRHIYAEAFKYGRARIAERTGVRVVPLIRYPYKVFYRITNEAIEILYIHHAARRAPWEGE